MKRLFCAIVLFFLLTGCAAKDYQAQMFAMDTVIDFHIYGEDAKKLTDDCFELIREQEKILSATDETSLVGLLNQGKSVEFPSALLNGTVSLSSCTCGALDPTIYPLVKLWGFPDQSYRVPAADEITAALSKVGLSHVHTDLETSLDDGCALDFGAVAKGYTAQLCADYLANANVNAVFSLGGNIQTVGHKDNGQPWLVAITDPLAPETYFATLSLNGTHSIVTSGGYHRYFEQDGKRYHHILDPKTGDPAESGLLSVTIVADDGLLADGLSTALFVMGLEKSTEFYQQSDDFEAVFVTDDQTVYVTEGLKDSFSGAEFEVIFH